MYLLEVDKDKITFHVLQVHEYSIQGVGIIRAHISSSPSHNCKLQGWRVEMSEILPYMYICTCCLFWVVFCCDEVNDCFNEFGSWGKGTLVRAVQLHRWIGYLLLENSIHLVTQFLQETTYYTDLSNSLFTVRSQEEIEANDLGWGGSGWVMGWWAEKS